MDLVSSGKLSGAGVVRYIKVSTNLTEHRLRIINEIGMFDGDGVFTIQHISKLFRAARPLFALFAKVQVAKSMELHAGMYDVDAVAMNQNEFSGRVEPH